MVVVGDFNKILFHSEKVGGREHGEQLMCNFCRAIETCNLADLGHKEDFSHDLISM